MAVVVRAAAWGLAITAFVLVPWLAVAGRADVISAVFRNTIVQLSVPDALRAGCQRCRSRW